MRIAGLGTATTAVGGTSILRGQESATAAGHGPAAHAVHYSGPVGRVSTATFDPGVFARSWNFSSVPADARSKHYRESSRPDGTLLREYEIVAVDREIEIAPGLFFPAWTYNGQVPGPTIRATEGDRVRVHFVNQGTHPHTMHFHGWHPPAMDGSLPEHQVAPGGEFLYEFDAEPVRPPPLPLPRRAAEAPHPQGPLRRVHRRPADARAPPADEMVMVMNGFDTNFDADNEVYAVNTVAHFTHARADPRRGRRAGAASTS